MMGVYEIASAIDDKTTSYVGSSIDIENRWRKHIWLLQSGKHFNLRLQRTWDKWGEGVFSFYVLEQVSSIDKLLDREQYYLDRLFEASDNPYNVARNADASARGRVVSEETRHKMSIAKKGTTRSLESRRKQSESSLGRIQTEETRKGIGNTHAKPYPSFIHMETGEVIPAGRNMALLCREMGLNGTKMGMVRKGKVKHYKGWTLLEDSRRKQDAASQKSYFSEEHGLKIGAAKAGTYPAFIHRETNMVIPAGKNIAEMCRVMGLHTGHINSVIKGERKHHKGWMLFQEMEVT